MNAYLAKEFAIAGHDNLEVVRVLLARTQPDLHWKNIKGKSSLEPEAGNLELLEVSQ